MITSFSVFRYTCHFIQQTEGYKKYTGIILLIKIIRSMILNKVIELQIHKNM